MALWQIKKVETTAAGDVYQFTNKATKAVLAFSTKANATTVLDPSGVSQWTFTDGKIVGYYGDSKTLALSVSDSKLALTSTTNNSFTVELPDSNYRLKANELGDGISTFILNMGGNYSGDIFKDKELVATDLTDENKDYMSLQVKGDEYFDDGKAKYLGVDTLIPRSRELRMPSDLSLWPILRIKDRQVVANIHGEMRRSRNLSLRST